MRGNDDADVCYYSTVLPVCSGSHTGPHSVTVGHNQCSLLSALHVEVSTVKGPEPQNSGIDSMPAIAQ